MQLYPPFQPHPDNDPDKPHLWQATAERVVTEEELLAMEGQGYHAAVPADRPRHQIQPALSPSGSVSYKVIDTLTGAETSHAEAAEAVAKHAVASASQPVHPLVMAYAAQNPDAWAAYKALRSDSDAAAVMASVQAGTHPDQVVQPYLDRAIAAAGGDADHELVLGLRDDLHAAIADGSLTGEKAEQLTAGAEQAIPLYGLMDGATSQPALSGLSDAAAVTTASTEEGQ